MKAKGFVLKKDAKGFTVYTDINFLAWDMSDIQNLLVIANGKINGKFEIANDIFTVSLYEFNTYLYVIHFKLYNANGKNGIFTAKIR